MLTCSTCGVVIATEDYCYNCAIIEIVAESQAVALIPATCGEDDD